MQGSSAGHLSSAFPPCSPCLKAILPATLSCLCEQTAALCQLKWDGGVAVGLVSGSSHPACPPTWRVRGAGQITAPGPNMSLQIPFLPRHNFASFHSPHVETLQLDSQSVQPAGKPVSKPEEGERPDPRLEIRETRAGELDLPPQRPPLGSSGCSLVKYKLLYENNPLWKKAPLL